VVRAEQRAVHVLAAAATSSSCRKPHLTPRPRARARAATTRRRRRRRRRRRSRRRRRGGC
jgi:hypothetical protein